MDYPTAEKYVLGLTDYEKMPAGALSPANYDLRRMAGLLAELGNPHLSISTVHITGTKGKGSTAAMIASALTASGYRTGLYTSPHLLTLRERIQVDGQPIAEAKVATLVDRLHPLVERMLASPRYGALTTFEVLTALAFLYFAEKAVDYQVVEVGLGGRLDATNVVQPQVAVITPISLDHQEVLGPSVADIAKEKSGIIKPGIPVISSPQEPSVATVIEQVCQEKEARLHWVGRDITWEKHSATWQGQTLAVAGLKGNYQLSIPLLGDYQGENAAAAVAALEALGAAQLTPQSLALGLASVSWPGRLQVLGCQPWVVVDGAHNPYSMGRLREAVAQYFPFERLFLVFGASADKDIEGMVKELQPLAPHPLVTTARHPRAASPVQLASQFARWGRSGEIAPSVAAGVERARQLATPKDLILITGSLFVVAEALKYLESARGG